jgi:hypothetical protein
MLKVASGLAGVGSLNYQGTWNASSNVPTLVSSVGTKGYYYLVSVAGNTNLNGITSWNVNDWAVFDGTVWEKVDNNNAVISVNGQTGVVVLGATDVGATPNTAYVLAGTGLSGGGRLTGNVTVNIANTAVTPATYGTASTVPQIAVNQQGQITSASNVGITIPVANVTGAVPNSVYVLAGTGLTGGGALTGNVTVGIASTTVTAGSYGNASTVGTFTVNAQGQLTAAANAAISIPASAINTTIPNAGLANSSVTINGTSISLGGSGTVTASTTGTLTLGTGLTGASFNGSTNVTTNLANTAVTAGSYGNASTVGTFTVDAQGRLTAAANAAIAIAVSAVSGAVPNTVNVIAGTGLTGGGALTGNVTLTVSANTTQQLVAVQNNGVAVGTRQVHNFIPGTNITITSADDAANGRANVTISTSGFGTMATQNANAVVITGGTINGVSLTLDSINNTVIGNTTASTAVFTTMTTSGAYFNIVTKSAAYTLTTTDFTVLANASTAAFTLTLPTAVNASGQVYVIKKTDSSANAVTISTTSAQTIDNLSSYSLGYQYQGVVLQSNNSNWSIIGVIPARNGTAGTF